MNNFFWTGLISCNKIAQRVKTQGVFNKKVSVGVSEVAEKASTKEQGWEESLNNSFKAVSKFNTNSLDDGYSSAWSWMSQLN